MISNPATAANKMITGSFNFLNLNNNKIVDNAMTAEVKSVICRLPSTNTAPIIAPIAAAVTPSTKAFIAGCRPYFFDKNKLTFTGGISTYGFSTKPTGLSDIQRKSDVSRYAFSVGIKF